MLCDAGQLVALRVEHPVEVGVYGDETNGHADLLRNNLTRRMVDLLLVSGLGGKNDGFIGSGESPTMATSFGRFVEFRSTTCCTSISSSPRGIRGAPGAEGDSSQSIVAGVPMRRTEPCR